MKFEETVLPGCFVIQPKIFSDHRGLFVKTFHADIFAEHGIRLELGENIFSISKKDVVRGMHFQVPPCAHAKLVTCVSGAVLDVVVDLRKASPTFGQYAACELNSESRKVLYVPVGLAHGFLSLRDDSVVVYQASCVYAPEADRTLHWGSFGFPWPVAQPLLSDKDRNAPAMAHFHSPF